jgi:Mrp family chromosome partitioning ATPase
VGEISEALRRARRERSGDAGDRNPVGEAPNSEHLSRRVERRGDTSQQLSTSANDLSAESTGAQPLALDRARTGEWPARAVVVDRYSPVAESCRHLALRVRAELERRSLRSVAISGPLRNEGKTTIACNLALALASVSRGRAVALVDLDLRRPSIAADFQIRVATGIEDFLTGARGLPEICFSIEKPAVDVFPAARPHASAHELLVQPTFAALVHELERRYATVIFDTPPTLLVPDTRLILDHVGAFIAVARSGVTRQRALQSMLDQLPRDRFLGTILNEGPLPTHARQYGYYGGGSLDAAAEE